MTSRKNNSLDLPYGWVVCQSESYPDRKYFYNIKTGKSSWSRPQIKQKGESKICTKEKNTLETRKEELLTKVSKRKSDRHDDIATDGCPKRIKHEKMETDMNVTLTNNDGKRRRESPKREMPPKPTLVNSCTISIPSIYSQVPKEIFFPPPCQTPDGKNLAAARLTLLRDKLAAEVAEELNTSAPPNKRTIISLTTAPNETPPKSITEYKNHKSKPNQSPRNESVQSIPPQFISSFIDLRLDGTTISV